MTDPGLRQILHEESFTSAALRDAVDGLNRCLPDLPAEVRAERAGMVRLLIVHTAAERERALAEGAPLLPYTWQDATAGLVDAIVGLRLAPVTARP